MAHPVIDAVGHLVVLRDDIGIKVLVVVFSVCFVIAGIRRVGKSAGFAQFLEHDCSHSSSAEIFVEKRDYSHSFRRSFDTLIMILHHIDVFGIVWCYEYFVQ